MAFKTPEGTWRVTVRINGQRISKTFRTRELAKAFEAKARHAKENPGAYANQRARILFRDFAALWFDQYARVQKAKSSVRTDESVARVHLLPVFGSMELRHLTQDHLLRLRAELAKNSKPKTVNNIIGQASKMLKTAVAWKYLPENPWAGIELLPVDEQNFDYWTVEERDKFLTAARFLNPKFVEACLVACHTGLRLGELRALTLGAVRGNVIRVSASQDDHTGEVEQRTKNRKIGHVPMTEPVRRVIEKRMLFPADTRVFDPDVLRGPCGKLERLALKVGVKPIRFHDLRHTFASCLVMGGVDIYTVQRLMRHSNVKQTMRYAHLAPSFLSQEVSRLETPDMPVTDLSPMTGIATLR